MSTSELERRVAEGLTAYAQEVSVTEQDVQRMGGELRTRLRSNGRLTWVRPGWLAPAAAAAVVAVLLGWFLVVRPLAPVPAPTPPVVVTAPDDQLGTTCAWVTQADVQAALGGLAGGFLAQPVTRSTLNGVGSPTGPSWDLSCEVFVNAATNSAGALLIQTAGFDSVSAAQQYLQEHWVQHPRPSWTSAPLAGVGDAAFYQVAPPGYGALIIVLDKTRFTMVKLTGAPPKTDVSTQLTALYRSVKLPG